MPDLVTLWSGDSFVAELRDWVDAQLATFELSRSGPLTPARVRFWAALFHAPVTGWGVERIWVKVSNPGQSFEGTLLKSLGALAGTQVVQPIAVDATRGWCLMPDGGPTAAQADETGPAVWLRLLEQVATLQRAIAGHRDQLAVVPALPLESVVDDVDRLLTELSSRHATDPQHLSADATRTARQGLPQLAAAVALLARFDTPETLQPNDLSLANAFQPIAPGGPLRLFDLGDALWSHPFGVLHVPLRLAVGAKLSAPLPDSPTANRLADHYLRCWPEIPPHLGHEVLVAADRLGAVHRALSWRRLLVHLDGNAIPNPPQIATWVRQAVAR